MLRSVRPGSVVEIERGEMAKQLLDDWRWCDRRIPAVEGRLHEALAAHGSTLTAIFGIGDIGAATILAIVGDVRRFRSAGHFAAYNGTAPIEASSGDVKRHRLNQGGNRQLNAAIHIAAVTQVRHNGPGKTYVQRKLAQGKVELLARLGPPCGSSCSAINTEQGGGNPPSLVVRLANSGSAPATRSSASPRTTLSGSATGATGCCRGVG